MAKYSSPGLLTITAIVALFATACRQSHKISYNDSIRPIFNKHCLSCHGGVRQLSGYSLLFEESALGTGDSGKRAIVPGSPAKSEMIRRLQSGDPEYRMPLEHQALSRQEVQLIRKWIGQGAKWETHWAYNPPDMERFRSAKIKNRALTIDHFIREKLAQNGLEMEPIAEAEILARRVSLDITGLPPKEEWISQFFLNPDSNHYEVLVDSLLGSQNYGEKWASFWLDLARYADSQGYEKDPYRDIWRYRDWVIRAINQDKPFDEFTIEQIAGDLLQNPNEDQLIATAFHRNSMTNTEGGTEDEEFRIAAVIDRVNTTYETWMASTISCVQCHSHPYDPIKHEDFYRSFAIFNNTQDGDLNSEFPVYEHYNSAQESRLKETIAFINRLKSTDSSDAGPASFRDSLRNSLFPRLLPMDIDDFHNIQIQADGIMDNWSNNVNEGTNKRYYLKFKDIPLDRLQSVEIIYSSDGSDAAIAVFLDSLGGDRIGYDSFEATQALNTPWDQKEFKPVSIDLLPNEGVRDLVFEIINKTGRFPQGIVRVKEFILQYEDFTLEENIRDLQDTIIKFRLSAQKTPIMKERSGNFKRDTRLFVRGNYLVEGDPVQPGVPEIFHEIEVKNPDRLEFARWLVSTENPLTARVFVNRVWEQIFGMGIIESLEDFGTQSYDSSHPELLDYLAIQFMHDMKWSTKALIKEILMSKAYRQSSKRSVQKLDSDPENRLLSSGPRIRLSSEQLRDQALAVSGLLWDTLGGPPVMPPQPEGVWQVIYSGEQWTNATDRSRYRRAIYTHWRRSSPYPSMVTFDTPSREFCVSRRIRTNTPLQALVLLNDPVYVEASNAFARIMQKEGGGDPAKSIKYGYKKALLKYPNEKELNLLLNLYHTAANTLIEEDHNLDESENSVESPMAVVANAIINLDAFIMKN